MNACSHCASLLRAGAKFCSACGNAVSVVAPAEAPSGAAEARPPIVPRPAAGMGPVTVAGPAAANPPAAADPSPVANPSAVADPPAAANPPAAAVPAATAGLPEAGEPPIATSPPPAPPIATSPPPAPPNPREAVISPAVPVASPPAAVVAPAAATAPDPPRDFFTYNAIPAATPPQDTSALEAELPVPARQAAPAAPPPPPAAVTPARPVAPEPPPPAPPPPPKVTVPARERWSDGRIVAIAITAVLLVGGGVAALLLSGSDKPKPAAAAAARETPTPPKAHRPTDAGLRRQVNALDDLMKASKQGRAAAVRGDMKAAIANRSKLLAKLERLNAQATNARLKAGLSSFTAAIRESLRQNSGCAARCSTSDLNKVNRLKQDAVTKLNPLLRKYAHASYRSRDI